MANVQESASNQGEAVVVGSKEPIEFAQETHHTFTLSDGRTFSYYSFHTTTSTATLTTTTTTATNTTDKGEHAAATEAPQVVEEEPSRSTTAVVDSQDNDCCHPIVYLHGFPGCGLEGSVCAASMMKHNSNKRCQVYAIDRPGFGHTDLKEWKEEDGNNNVTATWDQKMDAAIDDLWEFVAHMKWKSFSVIGISGGGPYALAWLASYLEKKSQGKLPDVILEAVCDVGGVCCSAGVEDTNMMENSKALYKLVNDAIATDSTWWSRTKLWLQFSMMSIAIGYLPTSILTSTIPTKDFPQVDLDVIRCDAGGFMMKNMKTALQQGSAGCIQEACMLFRSEKPSYEDVLKKHCFATAGEKKTGSSNNVILPRVGIFHGILDRNVPVSHATYVYKELLNGSDDDVQRKEENKVVQMITYKDQGHMSLIVLKPQDYAAFALPL